MPRNVEDIIPSKKRSIRDVPIPEDRRSRRALTHDDGYAVPIHKERTPEPEVIENRVEREPEPLRMKAPLRRESKRGGKWSRKGLWVSIGLGTAVVLFAVFSLMKSATLAYTPKTSDLSFENETYTAYKTGSDGVLLFSVVKISDTKGVEAPATGETQVSRRASGTIIVYNDASTQPQRLIRNTRFETPDGKIYRVQNDITIPGKSDSTPGSLEITVVADEPGASYNIGLTDFTLPGLKNDPRYTTIYARSKTPMSGGFVGTEKAVSAEDLTAARAKLDAALNQELLEAARAQVPADFVLFPSLSTTVYEDLPQSSSTASSVMVNRRGDMYAVIFKRSDLVEYMKNKELSVAPNQSIEIPDLSNLTVTFAGTPPQDLIKATQVTITVNGAATAVWVTNEDMLRRDLAGVEKSDLASVLKNYPSIVSADAIIRPFWKGAFPLEEEEITIRKNALK